MRLFSGVTPIVVLIAATGGIIPILPDIKVNDAAYADGKLTVTGEMSQPGQEVTLDGRYSTKANDDKLFQFEVGELPKDCIITLSSGDRTRVAVVRGCDIAVGPAPPDVSPVSEPAQPAAPHGSSSVSQ